MRGVAVHALGSVGARDDAHALATCPTLSEPANQLEAIGILCRGILTADMAAVRDTELALDKRPNADRVRIIAALGAHSSIAAQQVEVALAPVIARATRQAHVASALVATTRQSVTRRHSDRNFVYWATCDPEGFSRSAWSATLHAAGARIWDRNWNRLTAQADAAVRQRSAARAGTDESGADILDKATALARDAAIQSLVDSALSDDAAVRRRAWLNALEDAEQMPGTVAWTRYTQAVRAELGATTWTTTNNLIGDHVSVIINELPWIAGFVGMISLSAEAAIAAAKAGAVRSRAERIAAYVDIDDALAAAKDGTNASLPRTA